MKDKGSIYRREYISYTRRMCRIICDSNRWLLIGSAKNLEVGKKEIPEIDD